MEIRIGILNTGRELTFDANQSAAEVRRTVADALANGTPHVEFSDVRGNAYLVPTAGLAYVEIGTEESRRVGFVA